MDILIEHATHNFLSIVDTAQYLVLRSYFLFMVRSCTADPYRNLCNVQDLVVSISCTALHCIPKANHKVNENGKDADYNTSLEHTRAQQQWFNLHHIHSSLRFDSASGSTP